MSNDFINKATSLEDKLMAENKELTKQRDGFEEYAKHNLSQMKSWQEDSDEKYRKLVYLEKEFENYKIASARLGIERNQLMAENEAHRAAIGVLQTAAHNSRKQLEELTTRNQELLASARVMEDSLKNQAARLRLAESENDRLRRVAIEIKRKTSIVITVLIVLVTVVVLGGLLL